MLKNKEDRLTLILCMLFSSFEIAWGFLSGEFNSEGLIYFIAGSVSTLLMFKDSGLIKNA